MITTDGVTKRHGRTLAVDGVSVDIGPGLTAIIGPNGAGKSTLLACIGRLVRLDGGTVLVDGLDVTATSTRVLATRLAVLRQENHVPIRLSVADLVAFGRFPHGGARTADDRAIVDDAVAMLGLDSVRDRFIDELSGGQRQRAFVAMALAQSTDVLLLDEPLNNLDPRYAVDLMRLLGGLAAERGMTIVIVLHDIAVAARHADRIVAMKDGRVAREGSVDEVITAEFLGALYETQVAVEVLGGRRVVLWG